jgi:hypothetical protein
VENEKALACICWPVPKGNEGRRRSSWRSAPPRVLQPLLSCSTEPHSAREQNCRLVLHIRRKDQRDRATQISGCAANRNCICELPYRHRSERPGRVECW